jgi:hypothetical protein
VTISCGELVVAGGMGVITGSAVVVAAGAIVWGTGAGADVVHPADKRRAIKRTRITVLTYFIDCIIYGRVVICYGSGTRFLQGF